MLFSIPIAGASATALTLCLTLHLLAANVFALAPQARCLGSTAPAALTRAHYSQAIAVANSPSPTPQTDHGFPSARYMPGRPLAIRLSMQRGEAAILTPSRLLTASSPRAP